MIKKDAGIIKFSTNGPDEYDNFRGINQGATTLRVWIDHPDSGFCMRGSRQDAMLHLRARLKASLAEIEGMINKQMLEEAIASEINVTGRAWPDRAKYVEIAFMLLDQIRTSSGFIHPQMGRDMLRLLIRLLGTDPDKCPRRTDNPDGCGQSFCPVCGEKKK